MSTHKDRCRWIGVFKAPPHLSKEEFEQGLTAMARALAAVPTAQANMLWKEVSFANNLFDTEIRGLGLPTTGGVALLIGEAENYEKMRQVAEDPEIGRIVAEGRQRIGMGEGSMVFTADVLPTIDKSNL
ncbi:hypothetical protein DFH09DRAFT_1372768 [Mycena vulgaris]|nr:hypothetical protein DFH09DRAFT_1372768 [Mycena vulgaris]